MPSRALRVAVLSGGVTAEREVALRSCDNVIAALANAGDVRRFLFPEDLDRFLAERQRVDVAVPVFHGRGGEDGSVQGFLETLGIPYLFSGVASQAVCMEKPFAKRIVAAAGLRVAAGDLVSRADGMPAWAGPVVVKPTGGGSSVATTVVRDASQLAAALGVVWKEGASALVEKYIEGDEYTVAVVDREGHPVPLPVIAIRPKAAFFDFDAKYGADAQDIEQCPAVISVELTEALQSAAITAHRALGCRHLSRTDFIVDRAGAVWFLETNAIPGMTATSLLPKALAAAGLRLGSLLNEWLGEVVGEK
jgi:D-alanine-D-alanine ligase